MQNKNIGLGLIGLILFIILFALFSTKDSSQKTSLKSEELIGSECMISYGSTTWPETVSGVIKVMNDQWVSVLVKRGNSDRVVYQEFWIPFNKITHIIKIIQ